jgi:hypothetical protein
MVKRKQADDGGSTKNKRRVRFDEEEDEGVEETKGTVWIWLSG